MKKTNVLIMILLIMNISVVFADDNADIMSSLDEYYAAGKAEDIDRYVAIQDSQFLEIVGGKDYKAYFSAAFAETDVMEYKIVEPQIIIVDKNQAFVFYDLSAKVKLAGSTDAIDIDNSMAAAFWRYGDGWKVRYTMLRTVFDAKIEADIFSQAAAEMMVYAEDNSTMKEQFISEGKLQVNDEPLGKNESNSTMTWIIVVIIFGGVGYLAYFVYRNKQKKHHHK